MEYFMVPAQKVPSLQHFRKTEKEVIGGLCRYVCVCVCVCVYTSRSAHARTPCAFSKYCDGFLFRDVCFLEYTHLADGAEANMLDPICYCVHDPLTGSCGL